MVKGPCKPSFPTAHNLKTEGHEREIL